MIVLDTHTWIWWNSEPGKLSENASAALDEAQEIGVCSSSCWEISTKVSRGQLSFDRDLRIWVEEALTRPRVRLVPLSAEIALRAGELGLVGFHGDPADRMIAATAILHDAPLVTKDAKIRSLAIIHSIW